MRVRHKGVRTERMGADIWTIVGAEGTRVSIPTGHRKGHYSMFWSTNVNSTRFYKIFSW
jgi:hypothetical protein